MTMRGWCFGHSLNAPRKRGTVAAVETQQEETGGGEKRHTQNLQCTFTSFSQSSSTTPKADVYAERRMECDVSSGQMRVRFPQNPGRICLYLSEVGQHVGTSFTHLGEEDDGCVENTCGTGRLSISTLLYCIYIAL